MQIHTEIRIEALRICRQRVKDVLKQNGYKIACFSAPGITEMAKAVMAHPDIYPVIIQQAWDICKIRYEAKRALKGAK